MGRLARRSGRLPCGLWRRLALLIAFSKADGTGAPDSDGVGGEDAGVVDAVVGGGEDVGEVEPVFVGDVVGEREEVDGGMRDAHVFGLSAREAAGEVGVADYFLVRKLDRGGVKSVGLQKPAVREPYSVDCTVLSFVRSHMLLSFCTQNLQSPHAIWKLATYRPPTFTLLVSTSEPTASTTPQNSCPRISPLLSWTTEPW